MTADEYCRTKVAPEGSTLHYSLLYVDDERRRFVRAVFAFFREVTETVDQGTDFGIARLKLDWWRREAERAADGTAQHPVARALVEPIARFNLPLALFCEAVDGARMDLDGTEYETFDELSHYCRRTSVSAISLTAQIFGYNNPRTRNFAENLGVALGLTDVVRRFRHDAQRGHWHIPRVLLRDLPVPREQLLGSTTSDPLRKVLARIAKQAENSYREALETLPDEDRYRQLGHVTLAAIRSATLHELSRDGYLVMEQRTQLPPLRKFFIAWKTARRERARFSALGAGEDH